MAHQIRTGMKVDLQFLEAITHNELCNSEANNKHQLCKLTMQTDKKNGK